MLLPGELVTERLRLCRWDVDCVSVMLDAISSSLPELRPWMPWAQAEPRENELRVVIEEASAKFDVGEQFEYSIFEQGTEELVGGVGLHDLRSDRPAIGYWVRTDRHGRGYATEAAAALTGAAFAAIPELAVIEITMDQANHTSAAIPPKLGYQLKGEETRPILTPGNTGRGWVWTMTRAQWTSVPDSRR